MGDGSGEIAPHLGSPPLTPLSRVNDVFLFGVQHTAAFLNMLVAMTYNPGLLMAVIVGEMAGVALLEPPAMNPSQLECH